MNTLTIQNPKTGRQLRIRAWQIEPRDVLAKFRAKQWKSAKDISWHLLSHQDSVEEMRETDAGDCARNNWSLSIVENALDWTLGLSVLNFIRGAVKQGKLPKPFHVGCSRSGDVFIVTSSGRVIAA
jgi:hypothetical protein